MNRNLPRLAFAAALLALLVAGVLPPALQALPPLNFNCALPDCQGLTTVSYQGTCTGFDPVLYKVTCERWSTNQPGVFCRSNCQVW